MAEHFAPQGGEATIRIPGNVFTEYHKMVWSFPALVLGVGRQCDFSSGQEKTCFMVTFELRVARVCGYVVYCGFRLFLHSILVMR